MMDATERDVLRRNTERLQAMVAGDLDKVEAMMSENLIFVHTTSAVESRTQFMARLRSGNVRYVEINELDVRVELVGEQALVLGSMRQEVEVAGAKRTIACRALSLWIPSASGWLMRSYQSTLIPAAA
ncbi:nuclear transport factor 2 family protein [Polaromonas aquatica]|uniref:Nuclear transport factor 2 family protein n=2 Tax=Polaromonas TaxID=52972 RepID=A0ABW1U4U7_9BURK